MMTNHLEQILAEPKRLEALVRAQLVDTPVEEAFDRLTNLASGILKTPVSLISLVEPDRQFFKSQVGLADPWASQRETPLSHSFCQHVVAFGGPLIIEDARIHPLVCENLAIRDLDVISYLGLPLTSPDGWYLGSLCVIDDKPRVWEEHEVATLQTLADSVMTEIKLRFEMRAKEELLAELQQRNAELDAFAHTVSHNLKNPISGIIGWVSLCKDYSERMDPEELLDILGKVGGLAEHSNDIINALLLLAGVNRHDEVALEELDMFAVLEGALARLEDKAGEAIVQLPDTFPPCLGYRPWVEEVWVNYISNAIKYGGQPPKLEFGAAQEAGGFVRYWIQDNGKGLQPAEQEKLFVPFSRIPQTKKIEGHGLGLSIVQTIIEKLGGTVGVTSEVGVGSEFSFTLPAPH